MPDKTDSTWEHYRKREYAAAAPLIGELGFELDNAQPHIGGERPLMKAVTTASGKKLILLGRRKSDGKRVVIKATSDPAGIREVRHERACRQLLHAIRFAYDVFHSPAELFFEERNGVAIFVQEFIAQEKQFLERPLREQFSFALNAFAAQEHARATTYRHIRKVQKTFGGADADTYLHLFQQFEAGIAKNASETPGILSEVPETVRVQLEENKNAIERYCGFLTHTDFVPHNFRVANGIIYLLDHSSLRFGNKHEGWARFLNFMMLHNPALEQAFLQYVRDNRAEEEAASLHLMRMYRLGELLYYHAHIFSKSSGDLRTLSRARVEFWSAALQSVLNKKALPNDVRRAYLQTRDSLRSKEEWERQKHLY